MKICFKCKEEKSLSEFYKHKQMKDGHLNKCKECTKEDVGNHRSENLDKIRAYDRARGSRQSPEYQREYRAKYPNKYKAHGIIARAIISKKLAKEPCEICGEKKHTHAHHDDYLHPLNIRWLCAKHHHQWHAKNGEARNPL